MKIKEEYFLNKINNYIDNEHKGRSMFYSSDNCIAQHTTKKFRPDFNIITSNEYLCIEIDEKQHKTYNQNDEICRMRALQKDVGARTTFLRINPDGYYNGKKIVPSPWKDNIIINQDEINNRLSLIYNEIDNFFENEGGYDNIYLEVKYLFYDYNKTNFNIKKIY